MKNEIINRVCECLDTIEEKTGKRLDFPIVKFDLRGLTAGQAHTVRFVRRGGEKIIVGFANVLRFNMELAIQNRDEFLRVTVPHEVSHIAADYIHQKSCAHGKEWRNLMMTVFDLDPERCHRFQATRIRQKTRRRFLYECNCLSGVSAGPNHHAKIQSGKYGFRCAKCKKLVLARNFVKQTLS